MSVLVTISGFGFEATVDSAGAQLMSLKVNGAEYLWQGEERWWPRRAPILFPIVGVLANGVATSAQGEVRLGRHGLARTMDHEVVAQDESSVTFRIDSTPATREAYPFDFRLEMTYALTEAGLVQTYRVTNTGSVDLPFCLGAHPAFNVPVPGSEAGFDDYELRFARPWTAATCGISPEGIANFKTMTEVVTDSDVMPLTHDLFSRLLTVTLENVPGDTVTLAAPDCDHGVEVTFPGFPYLGLWTATEDAPFLAIEPWRGVAAATDESGVFEEKRGIEVLLPGESSEHSLTIRPF